MKEEREWKKQQRNGIWEGEAKGRKKIIEKCFEVQKLKYSNFYDTLKCNPTYLIENFFFIFCQRLLITFTVYKILRFFVFIWNCNIIQC